MEGKIPIDKIFKNITSNREEFKEEIREWIAESDENNKIYQEFVDIYMITGKLPERFYPDKKQAWSRIHNQIHGKQRKKIILQRVAQIAAAIVLIFSITWLGKNINLNINTSYSEIVSPLGQKSKIILPDGSVVMLNGGSSLIYSNKFGARERKVQLTGEGYFNIEKNKSKKFVVQTNELDVVVFGTQFNVKAYENDDFVEVGLKKGEVGIKHNKNKITKLAPGQIATLDKSKNQLDISLANIDLISAWTQDELVFEEKPMSEIVKYLERWYGVEIEISKELLDDSELLTFKVKTESLRELLNLINLIKPIEYKINGRNIIITNP